ncbi:TPM domain-containing protein [Actinacidiphila glaucinigra]|uniref:TPM domain-containing protein n=1 Tax=Actinacidiphila glaucinigra TaxID=235986 RepID=UPI002DDC3217|nr:TPM domain-containing protein [Actinacidiphila glaucinigra]WSD60111.1 TPM domain-containing protein [Actinacidiphila glaucinigra]
MHTGVRTSHTLRLAYALISALTTLCWLVLPAADARADDPIVLSRTGQITDKVDALGDREGAVSTTLKDLDNAHRVQLYVAYVRDFSGRSAQNWADATAERNGLGLDDVLLAVATHDRQYAYSVDQDSRLTDAQLRDVAQTAVEPALRQNDWAGAAIGAADGIGAVLAGSPVPTPAITPGAADPGGAGGFRVTGGELVLPVVVLGALLAFAWYAYARRRQRPETRTTRGGGGWGGRAEQAVPLPELDRRARELLVQTDDAVRTSSEELGFATAQFGEEAAAPFEEALGYAESELTAAFRLRQQLDDAIPEDDAAKRRMLDEIIARCTEADRRLDAEAEGFDRLRALEQNAPQALEHAEAKLRDVTGRTDTAQATLTALGTRYAPTAVQPVTGHVEQARDRLVFAATHLGQAREAVGAGAGGTAAVHLRAAEGAIDQAGTFVDAVGRLAKELAEAAGKLPGALTETETDLAEARGMLAGTPEGISTADLHGRIARAESVVGEVRTRIATGSYDPIEVLRRVEEADASLEDALAGARAHEVSNQKARALLDQALLTARSAVSAASDFVTTHRAAVGSEARTRLAEAQRHLELAQGSADPAAALTEAQRADALARAAQQLAEGDVGRYGSPYGDAMGGRRGGGGMGGAVLGGILLGEIFGGMGRGAGGGMFGGGRSGGFGGGFGGGGPGSFGGGGTRGRRGGGGRF